MKTACLAALLGLVACDSAPPNPPPATTTAAPQVAAVPSEPEPPPVALEVGEFDATTIPPSAGVEGTVEHGLRFTDANGDNLVVLWSDANQGLWAKHLVLTSGDKELRELKQERGECEFDYSAAFVPGSLGVTDLDADGLGEVTFAYKYACRSDMSPQDYKLVVLENGEKAILRGAEILVHGGAEPIGDGNFESEGFDDNPRLLEHARALWKRHVVTQH